MLPQIARPLLALSFVGFVLPACADDVPQATRAKGEVDRDALAGGVAVTIASSVGSVEVPFVVPVPAGASDTDGGDDVIEDELSDSVSLVVMSNASGATANLTSGIIVESVPAGAGQWRWELNGARDLADLTFFNATVNGLTLKSGNSYTATLAITSNDYIQSESSFTFPITVVGN